MQKRVNCQKRARDTIYLWARVTNLNERDDWQRAFLDKRKEKGDGIPTRYRKLGKKLVSIYIDVLSMAFPTIQRFI